MNMACGRRSLFSVCFSCSPVCSTCWQFFVFVFRSALFALERHEAHAGNKTKWRTLFFVSVFVLVWGAALDCAEGRFNTAIGW